MADERTNKAAMAAAEHRWIEEAADKAAAGNRAAAAAHLNNAAARVERLLRELGNDTDDSVPTPKHLVGFTCWDLSEAADRLRVAAFAYERLQAAA